MITEKVTNSKGKEFTLEFRYSIEANDKGDWRIGVSIKNSYNWYQTYAQNSGNDKEFFDKVADFTKEHNRVPDDLIHEKFYCDYIASIVQLWVEHIL